MKKLILFLILPMALYSQVCTKHVDTPKKFAKCRIQQINFMCEEGFLVHPVPEGWEFDYGYFLGMREGFRMMHKVLKTKNYDLINEPLYFYKNRKPSDPRQL